METRKKWLHAKKINPVKDFLKMRHLDLAAWSPSIRPYFPKKYMYFENKYKSESFSYTTTDHAKTAAKICFRIVFESLRSFFSWKKLTKFHHSAKNCNLTTQLDVSMRSRILMLKKKIGEKKQKNWSMAVCSQPHSHEASYEYPRVRYIIQNTWVMPTYIRS